MNDPFVSFDTFSVGDQGDLVFGASANEPKTPPILARLPRVSAPPRPKTKQRFDDAEPVTHGLHHPEGGYDLMPAGPESQTTIQPALSDDPIATIRIDTVSPGQFADAPAAREAPAVAANVEPAPVQTLDDDPWAAWLLNLEAAILPYSRVIVLAAVIAAMGLTVVLLQGGGTAGSVEVPAIAPQVSSGAAGSDLATIEPIDAQAKAYWPPSTPAQEAGLQPLPAQAGQVADATVAAGPASAPRRSPQATLTGEVLPVEAQRINVANAAGQPSYPRTTR